MSAIVATGSQARVKSSALVAGNFSGTSQHRSERDRDATSRTPLDEELVISKPKPQNAYKYVRACACYPVDHTVTHLHAHAYTTGLWRQ
jgi:hypothetical protein